VGVGSQLARVGNEAVERGAERAGEGLVVDDGETCGGADDEVDRAECAASAGT
jgi:hypothetical protein